MNHLRLFGGAEVSADGEVVTAITSRRHPMALLAMLATSPACSMTRAKLSGYLWPEVTDRTARNRLTTAVHRIRSILGESVLRTAGEDLRLDPAVLGCDVFAFERAIASSAFDLAASLYAGPFMDGFTLGGSPEFEHWLDGERDRLRREYRRALEALAVEAEAHGAAEEAVRWWRARSSDDPSNSRVIRRLIQALASSGNPPEAMLVAEAHVRHLADELGTGPDPELRELIGDLRTLPLPVSEPATRTREQPRRAPPARRRPDSPARGGAEHARPRMWRHGVFRLAALLVVVVAAAGGSYVTDRFGSTGRSTGAADRLAARELVEQARALSRSLPPSIERAERLAALYGRAIELDPSSAEAWVGLAGTYVGRAWASNEPTDWADSARVPPTMRSISIPT
jgi:DNA-binding SARP family transcriptional activator